MIRTVLGAPLTARPWREQAYLLASLPTAAAAFGLAVVGVAGSALSLVGVGLPLLAAVLAGTRLVNRAGGATARAILDWHWAPPRPLRAGGPIGKGWTLIRDADSWRSLLYCFVKLPLTAVGAYLGTYAVFAGAILVTCPLWLFVPAMRRNVLAEHSASTLEFLAAQAVAVVLVWPWFVRFVVGIDRNLVRALVEPKPTTYVLLSSSPAGRCSRPIQPRSCAESSATCTTGRRRVSSPSA